VANHYEVLGLKRGCTAAEIRTAYRKLVLVHHPDRSQDPKSKEIFIRVTAAYEVIGNEVGRKQYEEKLDEEDRRWAQARENARRYGSGPVTSKPKPNPAPKQTKGGRPATPAAVELNRLVQLYSRGRIQDAEELARKLTESYPQEAVPYGILGDILRARGSLAEAAKMYAFAAQFDPRNPLYHRRHAELLDATQVTASTIHIARDREARAAPLFFAFTVAALGGIYLILNRDTPIASNLPIISTFTLSLVAVLFLSGVATGASFSLGGWLDRYDSIATNTFGRRSPTATLGIVALINFWAAVVLYLFIGLGQRYFNYSTSRIIGAVTFLTLLYAGCAFASYALDAGQVLLWGGNIIYLGTVIGWLVADAFRSPA